MDTELLKANLVIEKARLEKRRAQLARLAQRRIDAEARLASLKTSIGDVEKQVTAKAELVEELQERLNAGATQ